ncbi:unnamed protein product [Bursaphelenchus xylophilus]|uniref:(pine wood nematode) hypothetical protein n=1 Tax=Bursaphelenchus xylophilus TaxID=6326 RepID=A0A1I7RKJ8_BURXY|nr:unnamed protein product [Bursaphelenchus xylophilus]CAG9131272.1 unnamed protein product [Bursaphelenchus xylophilus]
MTQTLRIHWFFILIAFCNAEFSPDFKDFLDQRYGQDVEAKLERIDQGRLLMGSFGGRMDKTQPIHNRPVIFVHGTTTKAGFWLPHRRFFLEHGYSPAELYATTYGDGGLNQGFFFKSIDCDDVEAVRTLIIAVSEYTNSKVDIIAYSMGVAVSRKAILGGECAQTKKNLGPSITSAVQTFVSVGGLGYGMQNCLPAWPACNSLNGMICTSEFLRDVNAPNQRYEGQNSYAIYSLDDPIIGIHCCGHYCAELKNANLTVVRGGLDHLGIVLATMDLQYNLVRYNKAEGV